MNSAERQYIEYRPKLGLRVDVRAILKSEGLDENTVYAAPDEILEATQNLASDVLKDGVKALQEIGQMVDDIGKALSDISADGVGLNDVTQSRANRQKWDDYHSTNIDGSLAGELYPLLLDAQQNVQDVMDFINNELFGGSVDYENLEAAQQQEAKQIEALVRKDVAGTQSESLAPLKSKTEIVQALTGSIAAVQNFVNDAKVLLTRNVNDMFAGQAESVIYQLSDAPSDVLTNVQSLSTLNFSRIATQGQGLKDRLERLSGNAVQKQLLDELSKLRKLKLDTEKSLQWMASLNTGADTSPITYLIADNLGAVDDILSAYDAVLLDVHKRNLLTDMQYQELGSSLGDKEASRQTHKMIGGMSDNFDFNDRDKSRQVKRFAENSGVKKRTFQY